MALCFKCGDLKFGALCPCLSCDADSTGNESLDILFSDHRLSTGDLTEFGKIVAHFRAKTDDDNLVFWCFIKYISEYHGNLLYAEVPDEFVAKVQEIYVETELPKLAIG